MNTGTSIVRAGRLVLALILLSGGYAQSQGGGSRPEGQVVRPEGQVV